MAIYAYTGLNAQGKEIKDKVSGEGLPQAKAKIRAKGIMLLTITEQKAVTQKKVQSALAPLTMKKAVSVSDLALMTRQLATLIKAKIQIVDAFSALIDQVENDGLKVILSEVKQKVNEGASLAKALQDYPKTFNNVYINMVDAGEASGTLDVVLLKLADFTEAQVTLRNKIRGAMIYPVLMAVFGSAMMMIIFIVVIPKITKIFINMKKELPLSTKICIWISNTLQNYWWLIIMGVVGGYLFFLKYIASESGRKVWDRFTLKAPIFGQIVMMVNVSRFCSTLATLLNSGVPILASMKIVKNIISNVHMQNSIEEARASVQEGASLASPLMKSGYFPPLVTHMIRLGERSGELEPMLKIVAENYEGQVNAKLTGLTSILEPIMMICMGCAVGFIVFSVIGPMMSLNSLRH